MKIGSHFNNNPFTTRKIVKYSINCFTKAIWLTKQTHSLGQIHEQHLFFEKLLRKSFSLFPLRILSFVTHPHYTHIVICKYARKLVVNWKWMQMCYLYKHFVFFAPKNKNRFRFSLNTNITCVSIDILTSTCECIRKT